MNNFKNFSFLIFVLFLPLFVLAQTKYEREYRIKSDEVPEKAFQFIHSSLTDFSEKWYYEVNQKGNSIEAKLKYNKKRYSVEFDTIGSFQDIEVETEFDDLSELLQSKITASLQNNYSKHKIRKLQVQYSGQIKSFHHFLQNTNPKNKYMVRYELIVKGKKYGQWKLVEITISQNGELEKTEQIIFRNTDNIEF